MKVAVCLVGQYRQFDYTFPIWNIDSNIDVDYFVSTWNISSELRKYIYKDVDTFEFKKESPNGLKYNSEKNHFFQKITESKIKKNLPYANIKIYDSRYQSKNNHVNMVFLMKSCIDMIGDMDYDYILILRFDSALYLKNDIENLKKDVLYHSGFYRTSPEFEKFNINDIYWVGGSNLIKKFVKGMYSTFDIPHIHIANYIYENKFKEDELNHIRITSPWRPATIPFLKKCIDERKNGFNYWHNLESSTHEILTIQNHIGSLPFN